MYTLNQTATPNTDIAITLPDAPIIVCYGGGVDSTAMLIAMRRQNIVPDAITFADVGAEKPETYEQVKIMSAWCVSVGFPAIVTCRNIPTNRVDYSNLTGNCIENETLPSLAFGMKSCSIKWKQVPQDYFITGCQSGPNKCAPHPLWLDAQARGVKPVKLIGYDAGPADIRRSQKLPKQSDDRIENPLDTECPKCSAAPGDACISPTGKTASTHKQRKPDPFQYRYPLQQLGWAREECIAAIIEEGMQVPIKSACFFCPASQKWELWWLAGAHPDLFEKALEMEVTAMTGHHTRFDEIEMGAGFMELIGSGDRWPSSKTTVGLGRSFAWNHWARMNKVVNDAGTVIASREWCLARADQLRVTGGNAIDRRTC